MTTFYFPGCKYSQHNPAGTEKLKRYLTDQFQLTAAGCCSVDHKRLGEGDCAIYVCPTCAAILEESAPQARVVSIYEILLEVPDFPWPDFRSQRMTIQDCWRTFDHKAMQDAIRRIVKKMNIEGVELVNNYEKADFCGATLWKEPSPRYEYLAPKRLVKNGRFHPVSEEEQRAIMEKHGSAYETDTVICYCTGCMEGVRLGGHAPEHLLDLIISKLE